MKANSTSLKKLFVLKEGQEKMNNINGVDSMNPKNMGNEDFLTLADILIENKDSQLLADFIKYQFLAGTIHAYKDYAVDINNAINEILLKNTDKNGKVLPIIGDALVLILKVMANYADKFDNLNSQVDKGIEVQEKIKHLLKSHGIKQVKDE
jgi:hypothetical protein